MSFAQVERNCVFQSEVERVADQCVTDRYLIDLRNTGEEVTQIVQIEVVTRVESQAYLASTLGSSDVGRNSLFSIRVVACGVSFGVEFDAIGTTLLCSANHLGIRIDEDRNANTLTMETLAHFGQELTILNRIPTSVRCDGVGSVGHKCHLRGAYLAHQIDKTRNGITLDIEFSRNDRFQFAHIGITYVSFVGTGVYGDAFRAETLDILGCGDHIGHISASRITNYCNLIDIYA